MNRVLVCAILLASGAVPACAQTKVSQRSTPKSLSPDAMQAASFAGCYQLHMGRWWPWGFGDENHYVTPPSRIQLLVERGTHGFEQGELLIREIPLHGPQAESRESSFWQVRSASELQLAWTNGFVGVTLDLKKNRDGLTGSAHPHFDAGTFVPRIAHVTAQRIACDAHPDP